VVFLFAVLYTITMDRYQQSRQNNIRKLEERGLEILSEWDGTTGRGRRSDPIPVTVKNTLCGHTFNRNIHCAVCGKLERTGNINAWSELNSARWRQTASEWKKYRSEVTKLTRLTYKEHKASINPHNLPFGRAGTDGAYHLDHIVSVRYGFDNGIPPEQLAAVSNLQVIPWLDNVVKRDKIVGHYPY
jgi:hypothetical protein